MDNQRFTGSVTALAIFLAAAIAIDAPAQAPPAPALPPPPPSTIWNFLGIPQSFNKIRDATANARGFRPQRERIPPLKRIADPANLAVDNPAIQAAAKIKMDADLAPQKIKAIRYLATVCCGCAKNRDEVKQALLAALDDCTEEVRYEAAIALCQCANRLRDLRQSQLLRRKSGCQAHQGSRGPGPQRLLVRVFAARTCSRGERAQCLPYGAQAAPVRPRRRSRAGKRLLCLPQPRPTKAPSRWRRRPVSWLRPLQPRSLPHPRP